MSAQKVIWFDVPIKGFIGAKKETVDGQEVWVKIAPTKDARGFRRGKMRAKGK